MENKNITGICSGPENNLSLLEFKTWTFFAFLKGSQNINKIPSTCNVWNEHLQIHMHNNAYIQKNQNKQLSKKDRKHFWSFQTMVKVVLYLFQMKRHKNITVLIIFFSKKAQFMCSFNYKISL